MARRPKYVRNAWREVDHAIGAGTHYHDPKRQYFCVLLELKIAVERYKYFAYAARSAQSLTVLGARPTRDDARLRVHAPPATSRSLPENSRQVIFASAATVS